MDKSTSEQSFFVSKRNIALMLRYVSEKNREVLLAKLGKSKYLLYKIFTPSKLNPVYNMENLLKGTDFSPDDFKRRLTDNVPLNLQHLVYNLRVQSSGPNLELFSKDLKHDVPRLPIFKT